MDLQGALNDLKQKRQVQEKQQKEARAPLVEVFHSVQGEGRFVGVPMAFLRTATCPFRCRYCDTPNSYEAPATAPVCFGVRTQQEPNPVRASRAAELVRQVANAVLPGQQARRVSVTGGEPLVFPEFGDGAGAGAEGEEDGRGWAVPVGASEREHGRAVREAALDGGRDAVNCARCFKNRAVGSGF